MTTSSPPDARVRWWHGIAAAVALAITIVFTTVGDAVEMAEATGLRYVIVTFDHTLVWALLAVAFIIATIRGRWSKLSQIFAVTAGVSYDTFFIAVFLWP